MKISARVLFFSSIVLGMIGPTACGKKKTSGKSANLPLVTPPVKAATPKGFGGSTSLDGTTATSTTLSASDFKTRFFTTGPTNFLDILGNIDSRIAGINTQSAGITPVPPCLSQTPVAYTITPWGQTVTMYGQCYTKITSNGGGVTSNVTNDPLFVQWGVNAGITYLYYAIGAERIAVIATPIAGSTTQYSVQAWIGLGYPSGSSAWDSGSYGVMQIAANPATTTIEFTVAGMGFGYCGAQLRSDGTNIYAAGSSDMGATCNKTASLCVLASDATTAGTCASGVTTFALPPIGRDAAAASTGNNITSSWAASAYLGTGEAVTLNGKTTDALYFGPLTPTAGVTELASQSKSGS